MGWVVVFNKMSGLSNTCIVKGRKIFMANDSLRAYFIHIVSQSTFSFIPKSYTHDLS